MNYATRTNSSCRFYLWFALWLCLCSAYQPTVVAAWISVKNVGTCNISGPQIVVIRCAGGTIGTFDSGLTLHPGESAGEEFLAIGTSDCVNVWFVDSMGVAHKAGDPPNGAHGSSSLDTSDASTARIWVCLSGDPGVPPPPTWHITMCVTNTSTVSQTYTPQVNGVDVPSGTALVAPGDTYCFSYANTNKANLSITAKPFVTGQDGMPVGDPHTVAAASTSDGGWWADGSPSQPAKGATDSGLPPPLQTQATNAPAIGFQQGTSDLAKEATLQTAANVLYTTEYQGLNAINSTLNTINANINAGFGAANLKLGSIVTSVASIDGKVSTLITQGAVTTNLLGLHLLSLATVTNQLVGMGTTMNGMKTDLDGILANTAEGNRLASNILAKYEKTETNGVSDVETFSDAVSQMKQQIDVSSVTNRTQAVLNEVKGLGDALKDTPSSYDQNMWNIKIPLIGPNNTTKTVNMDPHLQTWWTPLASWSHAAWLVLATMLYLAAIYPVYERLVISVANGSIWAMPSPEVTTLARIGMSWLAKLVTGSGVALAMVALAGVIPVFFVATFNNIGISTVTTLAHSVSNPSTPALSTMIYMFMEFFPLGEVVGYFFSYWIFRFGATHIYIGVYAILQGIKFVAGGKS
jgi:hypothetical protein